MRKKITPLLSPSHVLVQLHNHRVCIILQNKKIDKLFAVWALDNEIQIMFSFSIFKWHANFLILGYFYTWYGNSVYKLVSSRDKFKKFIFIFRNRLYRYVEGWHSNHCFRVYGVRIQCAAFLIDRFGNLVWGDDDSKVTNRVMSFPKSNNFFSCCCFYFLCKKWLLAL